MASNQLHFKPFLIFLLLFANLILQAQDKKERSEQIINFSKTELTLREIINELNNYENFTLIFSSNEDYLNNIIKLSKKNIPLHKAFSEIKNQVPVEVLKEDKYYIIRKKNLKDTYKVNGSVYDATTKEALIAAQIFIRGKPKGTVSNENGEFSLKLKPGNYDLVFTYLGYIDKVIPINVYSNKLINVEMVVNSTRLDEVNVLDSFNDRENFARGRSIETIDSKIIGQVSTNDVNDALHGKLNGVWTTKVSGAPGDHTKIRIRGISSIFGSTDPLYVVDGMIIPVLNFNSLGIADLNSHDIESITVLKDASSTALYGYLGGNGVILIETKKGGGKTKYNFKVKHGLQKFTTRYDLMDSEDFYNTLALSDKNINTAFYKANPNNGIWEKYPVHFNSSGELIKSNNFQDELFRTGNLSEYYISGQGNYKSIDYYISGMYYKHNGVLTNSSYNKYTATANFSKIITNKLSFRLLYKASKQENTNNLDNYMGNDIILKGINYEPAYRFTPDSFLIKRNRLYYNDDFSASVISLGNTKTSPDKLFTLQKKNKNENIHTTTISGIYVLNRQLSFKANLSFSNRNSIFSSYIPEPLSTNTQEDNSRLLISKESVLILNQQYDLTYKKQKQNHGLDALFRYRINFDNAYWKTKNRHNVDLNGFSSDDNIYMRGSMVIFGEKGAVLRSINSFISNANYNYKRKYFVSLLTNIDRLKEGHYINIHDIFTSVAVSYDISKEPMLKIPKWIDYFNISANFGIAGNYPLNSLSNDIFATDLQYPKNDSTQHGAYISNLGNHNLSHEQVTELNYSNKISLFKHRIILSVNAYRKTNDNLLVMRETPDYFGGGFYYDNIGAMLNKGIDISLELIPMQAQNYFWITKFGFSTNKQRVTKLHDGKKISFNISDILHPDFYARENESLGAIYGYSYLGRWDDIEQKYDENNNPLYVKKYGLAYLKTDSLRPHSLYENDKTKIGNSIPKYTINWHNYIEYKNFAFEMLWYGALKFEKYNATLASTYISGVNQNVKAIVADSMNYHMHNTFYESSFFVEDASFIRLKTLSFSYSPKKKIASRINMKFKLSFENLITLTKYSGYDPEATIYTNNNFSDNAIDKGSYPNPRGVYLSINFEF